MNDVIIVWHKFEIYYKHGFIFIFFFVCLFIVNPVLFFYVPLLSLYQKFKNSFLKLHYITSITFGKFTR